MKVPKLFVHLYEAIFANEPAHSLHASDKVLGFHALFAQRVFLSVHLSTIVAKYTLFPVESEFGNFVVDHNLVSYFLENIGTLACVSPVNFPENKLNAEHYHRYMKEKAFKELEDGMKFFTLCKIGDTYVNFMDASLQLSQTEDIKGMCNSMGGAPLSHLEVLGKICATKPDFSVGNDALRVTCSNFNQMLLFDEEDNLAGLALEVNATLFI